MFILFCTEINETSKKSVFFPFAAAQYADFPSDNDYYGSLYQLRYKILENGSNYSYSSKRYNPRPERSILLNFKQTYVYQPFIY